MMHTLKDPIFKGNFRLFVGEFTEVEQYMDERDLDRSTVGGPHLAKTLNVEKDGCHEVLLWFRPDWHPNTPDHIAVLAHEALHATHFVLQHRGISDAAILDEVGNYYIEWLVREICARVLCRMDAVFGQTGHVCQQGEDLVRVPS